MTNLSERTVKMFFWLKWTIAILQAEVYGKLSERITSTEQIILLNNQLKNEKQAPIANSKMRVLQKQ